MYYICIRVAVLLQLVVRRSQVVFVMCQGVRGLLDCFQMSAGNAKEYACLKWLTKLCHVSIHEPVLRLTMEHPRPSVALAVALVAAAKCDDLDLIQTLLGQAFFATIGWDLYHQLQYLPHRLFDAACSSERGSQVAHWIITTFASNKLSSSVSKR